MQRTQALFVIDNIISYFIAGLALLLPLFFLPITTDPLETPKQILLVAIVLIAFVVFGLKIILEGKVSFRRTPLDIALAVIFTVILVSTVVSPSRTTTILAAIPMLAVIALAFLLINMLSDDRRERLVISSLLVSGSILSLFTLVQFLKIYILPFPIAQTPGFSLAGSLLTTSIFLVCLLPIGLSFTRSYFKKSRTISGEAAEKGLEIEIWSGFFLGTSIIILVGALIGIYQLVTTAKPLLLPQDSGLRTALQPLGVNFQTALFGTGPGTYLYNFTRFRDAVLNNTNLWNLRFTNSSSFFLEVLSTLGIIGIISYLFVFFRAISSMVKNGIADIKSLGVGLSVILLFLFSLFLPFTFVTFTFLFILLALYCVRLANDGNKIIYDVSISLVALRKGLLALEREETSQQKTGRDILPYILFGLSLVLSVVVLFGIPGRQNLASGDVQNDYCATLQVGGLVCLLSSDINFQKALVAAANNNAEETYKLQNKAIAQFPNRDSYHRVFSQTNLAIANAIALKGAAGGADLTTQDRQNIITLVQQSINFARNAVTLAPLNVLNWENLTNIYRSLIGFAQDADQFAITSAQQAINLDPTNPLLYVNLGGIYFQLGQYDLARDQFATATRLKPDNANAHYNLGHAYEAKGDEASLRQALEIYQTVMGLVPADSDDFKKMDAEIIALRKRIPGLAPEEPKPVEEVVIPVEEQEPLKIGTPAGTLPEQKPPVPIEGPPPPATASAEEE